MHAYRVSNISGLTGTATFISQTLFLFNNSKNTMAMINGNENSVNLQQSRDNFQRDVNVESPTSIPSALPVSVFGVNSTVPVGGSGIYPSPMASNLCRTQSNSTGSGSPHPIPSPLFYTSMSHAGYQASSLIPTPMQLSHYGNNLRAMTAFGNINSTPACITANLQQQHSVDFIGLLLLLLLPSALASTVKQHRRRDAATNVASPSTTMFDSKTELQIHTQVHMREAKPYKCSHCPKSFANSSYLSQHMRIHLGLKPFGPCQYCGRKFTQLSHLQQHLRTHTGEKPYKCRYPGCEKAFSQLSNLQSHSRCHQTDKPYKCNSCYKCFCDEQSLLDHIPKHKESKHLKVHICPYCGKSYTQAAYLAKHMTKHADKKPVKSVHDSFPAHNHMMQPQTCAYTPTGIASSMAAAGMTADPSAFTRLAGLNPLSRSFAAASSRTPYFAYDNFKSPAHPNALTHPNYSTPYNHLIRLDDIRNYAGQAAAAASAEHLSMLVKRDPREAVYN
ncbi:Zinc finger protein rotund [Trichinella zimbabwensis]|uniref:Zinc finger protein rotund n=1 Tax=Trichinella zimbabwensis TaxID=268475 RepID=A0A0V1HP44_9BILA|nr:Zinc finger protein rotund [Trichinella zimbabwensis]